MSVIDVLYCLNISIRVHSIFHNKFLSGVFLILNSEGYGPRGKFPFWNICKTITDD